MDQPERQRIDKWLFFARIVKSRTLAAKFVTNGQVRVDGNKISQAAQQVSVGQILTFARDRDVKILKILAAGERRGPASEAQALYEDLTPERPKTDRATIPSKIKREEGAGRPTKKERRETDRLRNPWD